MTGKEKMGLLEEMLELENGTLKEDTFIRQVENWDSMAAISLIALVDEEFQKPLSAEQIKNFITIKDILDYMG